MKTDENRWRRLRALIRKETLQVFRDPSSFVVAIVLPILGHATWHLYRKVVVN